MHRTAAGVPAKPASRLFFISRKLLTTYNLISPIAKFTFAETWLGQVVERERRARSEANEPNLHGGNREGEASLVVQGDHQQLVNYVLAIIVLLIFIDFGYFSPFLWTRFHCHSSSSMSISLSASRQKWLIWFLSSVFIYSNNKSRRKKLCNLKMSSFTWWFRFEYSFGHFGCKLWEWINLLLITISRGLLWATDRLHTECSKS